MSEETKVKSESVDLQQLAIWTAVAAVASAVINAILFFVTQGQFEGAVAAGQEFTVFPVIIVSIVQIVIGGILLGILDRFLDKPITVWMWIAIIVLVLSFVQPFMFLDWAEEVEPIAATPFILVAMHIIAGAITIFLLTTRTRKSA